MILDRIAFRSFQRASLLHVAAAGLLTIPTVLGMRRPNRPRRPGRRPDHKLPDHKLRLDDVHNLRDFKKWSARQGKKLGEKAADKFLEWVGALEKKSKDEPYAFDEDGVPVRPKVLDRCSKCKGSKKTRKFENKFRKKNCKKCDGKGGTFYVQVLRHPLVDELMRLVKNYEGPPKWSKEMAHLAKKNVLDVQKHKRWLTSLKMEKDIERCMRPHLTGTKSEPRHDQELHVPYSRLLWLLEWQIWRIRTSSESAITVEKAKKVYGYGDEHRPLRSGRQNSLTDILDGPQDILDDIERWRRKKNKRGRSGAVADEDEAHRPRTSRCCWFCCR